MNEKQRIVIERNGPYQVEGRIPLKEMAPVHTFNGEPVAWHTLKELPLVAGGYDLCRCGKSGTVPFCDKSHETFPFNGEPTADRRPYLERARTRSHSGETLADDTNLCMGAGFCGTRTTNVWKLFVEGERGRRTEMKSMVWRCPSGRITLFKQEDGSPIEPKLPKEIAVLPGGPLWVRGGVLIVDEDGHAWELRNRVTLCRCGDSENKPFCDGTHSEVNFDER
jgi:CDGSH-type Zn-finger protein